jgi:pyruvate dehydrogenase E1 component beta subunit
MARYRHHGGIFRVTKDLIDEFGANRVRDTPISESGFVGLGIGAAMAGMRPVVELLFMDFALVAADQIINQAATAPMSAGPYPFHRDPCPTGRRTQWRAALAVL